MGVRVYVRSLLTFGWKEEGEKMFQSVSGFPEKPSVDLASGVGRISERLLLLLLLPPHFRW